MPTVHVVPRFIRHRDAPGYLGIDRATFDVNVRPYIEDIPVGARAIAFDRLDLDAIADAYRTVAGKA